MPIGIGTLLGSRTIALFLAVAGGFVGGEIRSALFGSSPTLAKASEPTTIRARAVEIVDQSGKRIGVLGSNKGNQPVLAFFDKDGGKGVELTLRGTGNPVLELFGKDGVMALDMGPYSGKPRLFMSDKEENGRVLLGINEPHAPEDKALIDAWVLEIRGNLKSMATLGLRTKGEGTLLLQNPNGKQWWYPPVDTPKE